MVSPDFIVGIIGNVISVLLCASPMGAFGEVIRRKSAENYNALPYISALLCKSLWAFYGTFDPDGLLIVTVNSVGVFSQLIYVIIYLFYAPNDKKVKALIFVGIMNIGIPGAVISATILGFHGSVRQTFIGILCAVVTIAMYAAPLSVMRTVIKTKSVEYMPFFLSLFLLLNACCWFTFALLLMDYYVIVSNAIGILSSSAQLVIYLIYRKNSSSLNSKPQEESKEYLEEQFEDSLPSIEEGKNQSQDFDQTKQQPSRLKSRSASFPKPSLSRENSIQKVMKTFSLSQYHSDSMYILVP